MGSQSLAEICVHRGIIKRHGQHVGHRSAVATDHLDAGLRADHRRHGLVDRKPGIVGLDLQDLGRRLIGLNGRPLSSTNSLNRPAKSTPTVLGVPNSPQLHGPYQVVQGDRPLRLAVQVVKGVPQGQGFSGSAGKVAAVVQFQVAGPG